LYTCIFVMGTSDMNKHTRFADVRNRQARSEDPACSL
jgi:hypothetical protein